MESFEIVRLLVTQLENVKFVAQVTVVTHEENNLVLDINGYRFDHKQMYDVAEDLAIAQMNYIARERGFAGGSKKRLDQAIERHTISALRNYVINTLASLSLTLSHDAENIERREVFDRVLKKYFHSQVKVFHEATNFGIHRIFCVYKEKFYLYSYNITVSPNSTQIWQFNTKKDLFQRNYKNATVVYNSEKTTELGLELKSVLSK